MESEERGVAEAIALNLREMMMIEVPIIVIVCGEGGSGGALGIAIGDRVLMQEFAVYSVIPPEGCAAILWRDAEQEGRGGGRRSRSPRPDLMALGLVDAIIPEPTGGAHNDYDAATALVDQALSHALATSRLFRYRTASIAATTSSADGRRGRAFVDTSAPGESTAEYEIAPQQYVFFFFFFHLLVQLRIAARPRRDLVRVPGRPPPAARRLELELPRFDRNTNTGGTIAAERIEDAMVARNAVHHRRAYPSQLVLPVIDRRWCACGRWNPTRAWC